MKIVSFTEVRNSLKAVWDGVVNDASSIAITHRDSEDAVVISLDCYKHSLRLTFKIEARS
ncbi:type II toxin-antitoxin system Phd/YefM family antitoxin [Vibrio splendidus]|uniref:type II toxin-antitoxin system Phd/YefM family antitoxin n=1 Tax=Vibrio splendidus TaxID=29497 RepID=UPI000C842066